MVARVMGTALVVTVGLAVVITVVVVIGAIEVVDVVMNLVGLFVGGAEVGSLNWGKEEEGRI